MIDHHSNQKSSYHDRNQILGAAVVFIVLGNGWCGRIRNEDAEWMILAMDDVNGFAMDDAGFAMDDAAGFRMDDTGNCNGMMRPDSQRMIVNG